MDLKLERLSSGEQIAAGSALALLVCMFFGWFNFGFETRNAWESLHFISPILTVVIVLILGLAFMKASEKSVGDIPVGSMTFTLGAVATLLILYRLIDPISLPGAEGFEPQGSVQAGVFLGLLAAVGIAAGGYLATGGTALNQLKGLIPSAGPASPAQQPPSPAMASAPARAFCEECGVALDPNDRFCSGCGKEQAPSAG
ncbi:MAG TPA: zinc ribbon domain-containing protein [Solirubrobacterales bacterium]